MKAYSMEAMGTFFLLLAALFSANPIAIGLMFMAMVYCGSHISGGHFNPAVTLAVWLRTGIKSSLALSYAAAQTVGAFVAAYFFSLITGNIPLIQPAASMAPWKATCMEAVLTFAFCFVILNVTYSKKLKGNDVYGLVIGLTLTALIYTGYSVSGAIFNPAIGAGVLIYHGIMTGTFMTAGAVTYIVGPLLGGAAAAYTYRYFNQ